MIVRNNLLKMKRTNIDYGIDLGTTNSAIARLKKTPLLHALRLTALGQSWWGTKHIKNWRERRTRRSKTLMQLFQMLSLNLKD